MMIEVSGQPTNETSFIMVMFSSPLCPYPVLFYLSSPSITSRSEKSIAPVNGTLSTSDDGGISSVPWKIFRVEIGSDERAE